MGEWDESQISYLKNLSQNCERLAQRFNTIQAQTKSYQNRLKLPAIILSSVAGLFSFGSSSFDDPKAISITVGGVNILIAILNSLDSLFGLTDTIQKGAKAAVEFSKLKEHIDLELAMPCEKRSSTAEVFMRDVYNEYLSIYESCPQVLKNLRWINPSMRVELESLADSQTQPSCFNRFKNPSPVLPEEPPSPSPPPQTTIVINDAGR